MREAIRWAVYYRMNEDDGKLGQGDEETDRNERS